MHTVHDTLHKNQYAQVFGETSGSAAYTLLSQPLRCARMAEPDTSAVRDRMKSKIKFAAFCIITAIIIVVMFAGLPPVRNRVNERG